MPSYLSRRTLPAAAASLLVSIAAQARAEQVLPIVAKTGVMCRDPKPLADLTAPDGSRRDLDMMNRRDPRVAELENDCTDLPPGEPLTVVTRRRNTSIVTYKGQAWYLANIDVMTPRPDCIRDGARISKVGRVEYGTALSVRDETTRYQYIRLRLDAPLCWIGNNGASPAEHVISLPTTSEAASRQLASMVGRHVTVAGMVTSPDNGNQPPDPMMMFDPAIAPAP